VVVGGQSPAPIGTVRQNGALIQRLVITACDGGLAVAGFGVLWQTVVDINVLVNGAFDAVSKLIPAPDGQFYPTLDPWTYVGFDTKAWVTAASWHDVTAQASAGGVVATGTARPQSLRFDPGDGTEPMACPTPPAQDAPCVHVYEQKSAKAPDTRFPGHLSIDWEVEIVVPAVGVEQVRPVTTTTDYGIRVAEIQTIYTN
jgi:hypothetical protein